MYTLNEWSEQLWGFGLSVTARYTAFLQTRKRKQQILSPGEKRVNISYSLATWHVVALQPKKSNLLVSCCHRL